MAHRLGIPNSIPLSTGPAITLGVSPVSPLWMTAAYSTLADNGIRHQPLAITKVIEGENTKSYQSHGWQAVPDGVAYEADTVLSQTVNGTAFRTPLGHGVQAGKTGTAENYQDAWFCGFTPMLASCVWMGYPKGEIPMTTLPLYGNAFGGDYPAEMWTQFMKSAFQLEPHNFPAVCRWPLPKHPVIFKPFHSQFTLTPPNPCAPVNGVVPNTPTCRPKHTGQAGAGRRYGSTATRTSTGSARRAAARPPAAAPRAAAPPAVAAAPDRPDHLDFSSMLAPSEALELILARTPSLGSEEHAVSAALVGRVVSAPVVSPIEVPPFAISAMDGYAVRAADLGDGPLPIAFRIAAGDAPAALAAAHRSGHRDRRADARRAPTRWCRSRTPRSERARWSPSVRRAGAAVRAAGGDVGAGDTVASAGDRLTPGRLAAIAAVGVATRPGRCAAAGRGAGHRRRADAPGQPLEPGMIYESNTTTIGSLALRAGAEVMLSELVPDNLEATRRAVKEALAEADVLVSSGGVSVGPHDHVKPALLSQGVEEVFWRIAHRPGKPLWFGVSQGGKLVFGIPGNPVSRRWSASSCSSGRRSTACRAPRPASPPGGAAGA